MKIKILKITKRFLGVFYNASETVEVLSKSGYLPQRTQRTRSFIVY